MGRHGFTASGRQRWRCVPCNQTGVRKRRDTQQQRWRSSLNQWLIGSERLATLSKQRLVGHSALRAHFAQLALVVPLPTTHCLSTDAVVILDGTTVIKHQSVALIARTLDIVITWRFAVRECFVDWRELLKTIDGTPMVVVMDGQKGLEKAVEQRWPGGRVQRCIVHVHRQAMAWLTRSPKTLAGQELRQLVGRLLHIGTRADARHWQRDLDRWRVRHEVFLRERTINPINNRRWWYTHRKLRAVQSLLINSAPKLFTFLEFPGCPKTSNHLEGGINARLKDLGRCHRGISNNKKHALVAWYLRSRQ